MRALLNDPNQPPKHVRGWGRNELRRIARGDATQIRLPGTRRTSQQAQALAEGAGDGWHRMSHV